MLPQAFPYLSVKWQVGCFPRCSSLWNEMETLCCCGIFCNFFEEQGRMKMNIHHCSLCQTWGAVLYISLDWFNLIDGPECLKKNIWGILPCSLCFKHQGKLVWSNLKEPLSQKLPYHSNYASTRQTAWYSAMHVKMGLIIEPFANSDMLYFKKSKHKKLLIFLKNKTHQ